ncbi:PAS domain S-box protein [Streptomyces diastaticus]
MPGARAHSPSDVRADAFRRAPMAMAVLDRAGRVVEANDAFAALLGTGPGARSLSRVAAELLGRPGDEAVRAVLEGRRAGLRRTRRVRDAEGRARWLLVAVDPPRADGPGGGGGWGGGQTPPPGGGGPRPRRGRRVSRARCRRG